MKIFGENAAQLLCRMGEGDNFIGDLVVLAGDFGVSTSTVAEFLVRDHQCMLVLLLAGSLFSRCGRDMTPCMDMLIEAAHAYMLPMRFMKAHDALVACLDQEGERARARLTA